MSRTSDGDEAGRPVAAPSAVARDRLAARVRHDVADIRVRLEEATLRSDAYLMAGYPEDAREVLGEQEALLAELREQVASSLAAAAVEAEAEAVLLGCGDAGALFGEAERQPAPGSDLRRSGARTAASALVSAVAALALLVMVSTPPGPQTLAAAGVDDRPTEAGDVPAGTSSQGLAAAQGEIDGEPTGPNELEVRRLFSSPTPRPAGSASEIADSDPGARTSGLQSIVDGLLATAVRALEEATGDETPVDDEVLVRRARRGSDDGASGRGGDDGASDGDSRSADGRDDPSPVTSRPEGTDASDGTQEPEGQEPEGAQDGEGDQGDGARSDEGDEDGMPVVGDGVSDADGLVDDR